MEGRPSVQTHRSYPQRSRIPTIHRTDECGSSPGGSDLAQILVDTSEGILVESPLA